ncbi:hypothetical protein AUP68_12838 [Ilyonectria robusta]
MHHGSTPSSEHADTGKVSELAIRPRPQATGQPTATARLGFKIPFPVSHVPDAGHTSILEIGSSAGLMHEADQSHCGLQNTQDLDMVK